MQVREPEAGSDSIVCANHFQTAALKDDSKNRSQIEEATSVSRQTRLAELIAQNRGSLGAAQAVEIASHALGPEHPETLRTMNSLSVEYINRGKLTEAEGLAEKTLEIRKRVLGHEHPDTLLTMKYLADIFKDEGKSDEAERLYRDTLEIDQRVFGPEHPFTLNAMNNFAQLLRAKGKLAEAEAAILGGQSSTEGTLE